MTARRGPAQRPWERAAVNQTMCEGVRSVVMAAPPFDDDLRFLRRAEDLAVEKLVSR